MPKYQFSFKSDNDEIKIKLWSKQNIANYNNDVTNKILPIINDIENQFGIRVYSSNNMIYSGVISCNVMTSEITSGVLRIIEYYFGNDFWPKKLKDNPNISHTLTFYQSVELLFGIINKYTNDYYKFKILNKKEILTEKYNSSFLQSYPTITIENNNLIHYYSGLHFTNPVPCLKNYTLVNIHRIFTNTSNILLRQVSQQYKQYFYDNVLNFANDKNTEIYWFCDHIFVKNEFVDDFLNMINTYWVTEIPEPWVFSFSITGESAIEINEYCQIIEDSELKCEMIYSYLRSNYYYIGNIPSDADVLIYKCTNSVYFFVKDAATWTYLKLMER